MLFDILIWWNPLISNHLHSLQHLVTCMHSHHTRHNPLWTPMHTGKQLRVYSTYTYLVTCSAVHMEFINGKPYHCSLPFQSCTVQYRGSIVVSVVEQGLHFWCQVPKGVNMTIQGSMVQSILSILHKGKANNWKCDCYRNGHAQFMYMMHVHHTHLNRQPTVTVAMYKDSMQSGE